MESRDGRHRLRDFVVGGADPAGREGGAVPCALGGNRAGGQDIHVERAYRNQNVAIIGLGVGSIASYSMPGQHFVFYEIDPAIELIARNDDYFTFLATSKGSYDIVIGDGRLTMKNAPEHSYGMIILDAFSSDAIPVHLLTKEAIMLYLAKLDAQGIIAFHISNNYVNLEPVLSNLAKKLGLDCLVKHDVLTKKDEQNHGKYPSDYVVMGRFTPLIKQSLINAKWQKATLVTQQFYMD